MNEYLHDMVIGLSLAGGLAIVWIVIKWHVHPDHFDLKELFTTLGRDKKQHVSRPAVAELVALFATTSAYLSCLTLKPEAYAESTLVYGSIWTLRGGLASYLRSKQK